MGDRRLFFFFQAEDGIRDGHVTGVQTCALPIWTVAASAVLATALAMLPAGPAHAAFPGSNGRIAFESGRTDELDIYTAKPDGSDLKRMTSGLAEDHRPRWAPDGSQIVFWRGIGDGPGDIWIMDADGSNKQQLTSGPANDEDTTTREVWRIEADGTKPTRL